MKFVMLAEGRTEKESAAGFLKRWLDPRLSQPVGIQMVHFEGYSELARKMADRARMHLDGPRQTEIIAVVALLDLYGPNFYPQHITGAQDRYDWAVAHFTEALGLERFRMFFAVHEFEAWLLSQPEIFPRAVQDTFPKKIALPETINFDEPPAKLLDRIYRQATRRSYKKTTYGKQLFAKLDPNVAADKCPYLRAMLAELLELAKAAGL
ncbi:MAG: DUF4276 family protein [Planctomycetes bacterium]|nr:DUF4276 family protein [Planctomycetota bacterium]